MLRAINGLPNPPKVICLNNTQSLLPESNNNSKVVFNHILAGRGPTHFSWKKHMSNRPPWFHLRIPVVPGIKWKWSTHCSSAPPQRAPGARMMRVETTSFKLVHPLVAFHYTNTISTFSDILIVVAHITIVHLVILMFILLRVWTVSSGILEIFIILLIRSTCLDV